jgi:hypothetical protein
MVGWALARAGFNPPRRAVAMDMQGSQSDRLSTAPGPAPIARTATRLETTFEVVRHLAEENAQRSMLTPVDLRFILHLFDYRPDSRPEKSKTFACPKTLSLACA